MFKQDSELRQALPAVLWEIIVQLQAKINNRDANINAFIPPDSTGETKEGERERSQLSIYNRPPAAVQPVQPGA